MAIFFQWVGEGSYVRPLFSSCSVVVLSDTEQRHDNGRAKTEQQYVYQKNLATSIIISIFASHFLRNNNSKLTIEQ
jgi:hypothetical protein